jgi:hypothetical protein
VKTTVLKPKNGGGLSIEIPDGAIDDAIATASNNSSASVPAFPGLNRDEATTPAFVKVWRVEPPDGYLGQISAEGVSEETLTQRFGGYLLEAECVGENGRVMTGGKKRQFRLNAPPVATHIERQTALERKANGNGNGLVQNFGDVEKLITMQSKAFEERITLLKQEAAAAREERAGAQAADLARIKAESEAYIARTKADAEERERRDSDRHKREIELERERNTASQKQHESFLATMAAASSRSTDVVVAALQSSKSSISEIVPLITAVAPLLSGMMGGGDPSIAIANSVSRSIEGIADIATGDRRRRGSEDAPGERRRLPEGKEEKGDDAKEGAAPKEDKARVLGKVAKLFKAVKDSGNDVEQTLDDAIKFYTSGKGNVPVDEEEEEEETANGGPIKKRPRVARSGRVVARGAGKATVGRRRAGNGAPDAPVNTRKPLPVDSAAKRSGASASGAAVRSTEHQVPARKA